MTFAEFYAEYPRKIGKKDAEKAWNKLKVTAGMASQIGATLNKRKREDWKGRDVKFIPYPAHFLRAEGFDDEVEATMDDPLPLMSKVSSVHVHRCTHCAMPHDWLHDDEMCFVEREMICYQAYTEYKDRQKAKK